MAFAVPADPESACFTLFTVFILLFRFLPRRKTKLYLTGVADAVLSGEGIKGVAV
jgi:hypothetical protein